MTVLRNRLLARITAPAGEPINVLEAKSYLRVDHAHDDALIGDLITAARMTAEHWLKRSLMTQSWKLAYDDCAPDETPLPMGPVASVTSVTIVNRDTTTQTVTSDSYYLNAAKNALMFDAPVLGFRVEIVYSAGYGVASSVPRPIKQGMLAHIAAMYDHRGEACDVALPEQSARLYLPFREVML